MSEGRRRAVRNEWRTISRYRAKEQLILNRITEIAHTQVRYGYRSIHVLMAREGWPITHRRLFRLSPLAGLNLRMNRPRRQVFDSRMRCG